MNKILSTYTLLLSIFLISSCTYKPIFSETSYNFTINEIIFTGEKDINKIIKKRLNLIKNNNEVDKRGYNLLINSIQNKIIVSKNSKGDPQKFELVLTTYFEIRDDSKLLFKSEIEKNNIYNNVTDKFKLEQDERVIIENLSEKISEVIISSIINLNDS